MMLTGAIDKSKLQACYACNSVRLKIAHNDTVYRVLRCLKCGLYFVNPIPKIENPEFHFSNTLYKERNKIEQMEKEKYRALITSNEIVKLSSERRISGNRILDIGCGFGFFLKEIKEYGWQVYGCEQNITAKQYAEKMGLMVYQNLKQKSLWKENYYDVITCWNVVEHLDDPLKLLCDCQRLLRKGGQIIIRVPNVLIEPVFWRIRRLYGKKTSFMQVPMHLFGFSVSSLKYLLKQSGFINSQLIPSPLGDESFSLVKRFGPVKGQLIVKLVEYVNLAIFKLSFARSAGILSITMLAYKETD